MQVMLKRQVRWRSIPGNENSHLVVAKDLYPHCRISSQEESRSRAGRCPGVGSGQRGSVGTRTRVRDPIALSPDPDFALSSIRRAGLCQAATGQGLHHVLWCARGEGKGPAPPLGLSVSPAK